MSDANADLRNWERTGAELLLDCPPWFQVFADTWRLPSGKTIPNFQRIEGREYVTVIAVRDDSRILVFEGYRPGCRGVVLQFPAGYIDPGEEPQTAAARELAEEARINAARWRPLGSFTLDGNYRVSVTHAFLATGLSPVTAEAESDDPGEVRESWMTPDEVRDRWRANQFQPAATAAAVGLALDLLSRGEAG